MNSSMLLFHFLRSNVFLYKDSVINNLNTVVITFVILDLYIFSHFQPIKKLIKMSKSSFTIGMKITCKQGP